MNRVDYTGLKKRDTYDEIVALVEAGGGVIKYPNRVASQILNSPYMKQIDNETLMDLQNQQDRLNKQGLGLAPTVITDVFDRLKEIIEMGTAVVIVEQRANLVTSFAEKTIVIRDGKVQSTLTPADAAYSESLQRSYFGAGE